MLTLVERRAELRQKVGRLDALPVLPAPLRALIVQFWFETLGSADASKTQQKMALFCETLITKLGLPLRDGQDEVDNLCAYFCNEPDSEQVIMLIEYSLWVLGIFEKVQLKKTVNKLNLAFQMYEVPFEYINGEMCCRKS